MDNMQTGYDSRVAPGKTSSAAKKTAFPKLGSDGKKPKKKKQKGISHKVHKVQSADVASTAKLSRTQGTTSPSQQQKPVKG